MMKLILVAFFTLIAARALADSKVAECELLSNGEVKDRAEILLSDNGDEGFLKIITSKFSFTDNIQDDYASFLQPGTEKLYVSYDGARWNDGREIRAAAIYLKNVDGVITGRIKADFSEYDVKCEAMRYILPIGQGI